MKDNLNTEYTKYQSEFKEDPECHVIFATHGLMMGRMIGASKSKYCQEHQGDLIIFNANVITKSHGKIWYGELNKTLDFDKLKNIADHITEDLYILMEGDARFGYENEPIDQLIKKARTVIKCNECLKIKKMMDNETNPIVKALKPKSKKSKKCD
jgi:hypothetical protein